ncbi:MAG: gamma-mobile-trio integrase GmtZ [Neptuniibacter sp.]
MRERKEKYYSSIQEASKSAQKLRFKTKLQYLAGRSADQKLPLDPKKNYEEDWSGWRNFLGLNNYYSYSEASKIVQAIGFLTASQYRSKRHRDTKLPAHPDRLYGDEWRGWPIFFGLMQEKRYQSLSEASESAQKLGFSSMPKYRAGYKADPRLPSNPKMFYKDEWQGAAKFLGQKEKQFYSTLKEASSAALRLGFSSSTDYIKGYFQDEMLPSSPERIYAKEWKGWEFFFKRHKKNYYPTYQEASTAAQNLGIKTASEYRKSYKLDPRLPSTPDVKYASDWMGLDDFLGKETVNLYENLEQASKAACEFGFSTMVEYRACRAKDPRLPSDPSKVYQNEWKGADHFLNRNRVKLYSQLNQASIAARRLGFETKDEYVEGRYADPQLPACPNEIYSDSWGGWQKFLGTDNRFYSTYLEASKAAQNLGFRTMKEYREGRYKDPLLPGSPSTFYSTDWKGFKHFLSQPIRRFYKTLKEASESAQNLEITTLAEYKTRYLMDDMLPAAPWQVYCEEWEGFPHFIGSPEAELYKDLGEASIAAQNLGITSSSEYRDKRKQDPGLPASPIRLYGEDWPGWNIFLGKAKSFYSSLKEASKAVQLLKIKSMVEYKTRRREDSKLPANPERVYSNDWVDAKSFLGLPASRFYLTLEQASNAAKKLGLSTVKAYRKGRHADPKLPAVPSQIYRDEWKGFASFLAKDNFKFYLTLAEASSAAQKLGFTTNDEYKAGYHRDPQLPSNPERTYSNEWNGTRNFLGVGSPKYYQTIGQASESVRALGFTSRVEYKAFYDKDPRLHNSPEKYYSVEWVSWQHFMLPTEYHSLKDVKTAVKILGITDSKSYREVYKSYPPLPAHPDRIFKDEWVDWYELCDITRPYSYDKAVALIAPRKLSSKREYLDFITQSDDPRIPKTPDQVYKDRWVNWYVYLGTREPYRIKNIRSPYTQWADCIQEFLKGARGGGTKESHLCRFVRHYIQAHEMGESPQKFLTLEKKDIRPFKRWLEVNQSKGLAYKTLTSVNEFLDFVVHEYLTDEDEETGELVLVANTHNPFSNLSVDNQPQTSSNPGESVKHALAYQYVAAAKEWMIPVGTKSFSDLTHLHAFSADWFDIDLDKVDKSDPNCVFRKHEGQCQIWFPVYWMHTYALMSVPARGRQIAYCDSGEADELIPVITASGSIGWETNNSPLAGKTNNQSFIKHYENGELGVYFTSNKTGTNGNGYSVAWVPEDLAYWMVLLRNWQAKYNPISRPMPWFECVRTSLNHNQRIAKGSNCFLFRDFGIEECGHFSSRLASRLSAALYHSQQNELELASFSGVDKAVLGHYSSKYTPHSMRVSLITAYVDEFGLPLPIIMKVAGHSSIVMTIYYCKIGSEDLRRRFSEGEKRAMQNKTYAAQRMIEQGRIDEIKNELIATSSDALNLISNETPVGTYLFRDYGICPYGGSRCADGGDIIQSSRLRSPTPAGYLGSQNCIACRHFITGPAFVGGLLSLGNEISLASHLQYEQYHELEQELKGLNLQVNECDDAAYDAELRGESFDHTARNNLELQKRKTLSEIEAAAKKLDSLLCDMNRASKLLKQCQALVNQDVEAIDGGEAKLPTKLIVQKDHELHVNYEEVSRFKQLSEVCENAEIYQSASSEMALAPRSQLIDKMALRNKVPVHMFLLDKKQQLVVGNQITRLMLDRMKSWRRVDSLMDGRISLEDLDEGERITKQELLDLVNQDDDFDRVESISGELL